MFKPPDECSWQSGKGEQEAVCQRFVAMILGGGLPVKSLEGCHGTPRS
jgi:hypothetical protein